MAKLLHIDSSPMGEASVTRHLTKTFVENWKQANAGGEVIVRDLTTSGLESVTGAWVGAAYTPEDKRSAEQKQVLEQSDTLLDEMFAADEYVFGVPMHNFGVPSVFKQWIDLIARVGKTFSYVDGRPQGMVKGKKVTFFIATGGVYDAGSAAAGMNFTEPYLKVVFGFLGITNTTFHTAGKASSLNYGGDRAEYFAPHEDAVKAMFAKK